VSDATLLRSESLGIARVAGQAIRTGIDLEVRAGGLLAVTGPNGAGKSTLGLTLGGLLAPLSGHVIAAPALAAGAPGYPIDWKSRQLLTRIGSVFQDPEHQFLAATVQDELAVGPRALGLAPQEVDVRVDELLERLRLASLARANPFTLSGGEKRRLSVGTVLATRPRVLVLDEPTFGQDSRTWRELVTLLSGLLDVGSAVVAITHDVDFVGALATSEIRFTSWQDEPGRVEAVR
jgi:energy-coupling factor transport system ATP-binding protein